MPKKLDLSDRYARGGQRRPRRRTPSLTSSEPFEPGVPDLPLPVAAPGPVVASTPIPRTVQRPRSVPRMNYGYVRTDLVRIGIVIAILLVLMAVLFFILR